MLARARWRRWASPRRPRLSLVLVLVTVLQGLDMGTAQAEALPGAAMADALSTRFCDPNQDMGAARQDRLLRVSDWLRQHLDQAGADLALVARAGLDLRAFGLRLSHAGVSLRQGLDSPWAVRQLYYACDEGQPRLFDQGLAGFMAGTPADKTAHFELLLLPPAPPAHALQQAALDPRTALGLLGATYTANAYAWGTRHQNCNQWLAELMGWAWGPGLASAAPKPAPDTSDGRVLGLVPGPSALQGQAEAATQAAASGARASLDQSLTADAAMSAQGAVASQRAQAQAWLKAQGYQPQVFQLGPWRLWLAGFWPMVALDDHPASDRAANRLQVSMPEPLLQFAAEQVPGSTRWLVCLTPDRAVLRQAGPALQDACTPDAGHGDLVLDLQPG